MKCPNGCGCGKHNQHHRTHIGPVPRNTTMIPGRRHDTSTYGDEQRHRLALAAQERRDRGIIWRGTPSDNVDWDHAIALFHQHNPVERPRNV